MTGYHILLLALLTYSSDGYKFLVYSPIFGYSHTNFMGILADTLTEAGHNVTMLMPIMDVEQVNKTGVKLTTNIIKVPVDERIAPIMKHQAAQISRMWTLQPTISGLLEMKKNMTMWFTCQCERVFQDEALMKQLEEEHFDVGIAEGFGVCGFGVFKIAKIKTTLATLASVHMDPISEAIGEPVTPSYVPGGMSAAGDQMNIFARLKNAIGIIFTRALFPTVFVSEVNSFKEKFGSEFSDWQQLLADASYLFTNSNPYLDYPRPMLHKTVPIGGITVPNDSKKNKLPAEWDAVLNERNTTVLVSFGSVAKAMYMPEDYKESLLKVFESMPETTFIFKYEEKDSKIADHLPNVHLSTWLPQNALLADPRLTAFVTHGGLGSVTELAHQGKPAVLIPIFGDQPRNAKMLAKHGGAIDLTKYDLETPEKLRESLRIILSDTSYSKNAKRLAEMLRKQPISPKELFLRHTEFAAKFGRLPNLDPYGRQLSFIQYYLIDIAKVVCVVSVVFYGLPRTIIINVAAIANSLILACYALFIVKVRKVSISDKNLRHIYRSLILTSLSVVLGWVATIFIGIAFDYSTMNFTGTEIALISGLPVNLSIATNFFVFYFVSEQYRNDFNKYLYLRVPKHMTKTKSIRAQTIMRQRSTRTTTI
ncbi:unnamed protein product [Cylicocyclus nassatus]|uniref:glucuronosyltransferase n=1 Tax=Cylicocyclus nassatus TaxID=53992 RepID=A0AA36MBY6_CYLNA|nr:unnamed protein product [Cylicocyclus nassatus]